MKYFTITTLIFGLLFFGCNQDNNKANSVIKEKKSSRTYDKEQIQNLMRQVLNWSKSKKSIDLLPVITDNKESFYIGFDLAKHKANLDKLRQTNFFATEFIDNYNQIILTLDKGIRNGRYDQWLVGDLPTFIFTNDLDPWCMCQDVPYDNPNPFDFTEVNITKLNAGKAEANWRWGKLESDTDPDWKAFSYKFRVVKENDKWKIAYLAGFDLKSSIRKDGL